MRILCCAVIIAAGCAPEDTQPPATPSPSPAITASPPVSPPLFHDGAEDAGLIFSHFIGATGDFYMPEVMGSGVALLDYDSDGDLDVYLLQGTMLDATQAVNDSLFPPPPTHWPGSRLFRNDLTKDGDLSFTDVTADSGLGLDGYAMGAATGDIDNDGDPDLYITAYGSNRLYRNDGGTFTDITSGAGVDDASWSTAAGFSDYDRDGDLDLWVVNYVEFDQVRNTVCTSPGGRRDYCGPQVYPPTRDRLFRNDGEYRFTDVSVNTGIAAKSGPGLGLVWADFDADGYTDAYVANDGAANFMWMNRGGQRFEEIAIMAGTGLNTVGSPEASMGVTAGDFDGDGDEDLFMTHLVRESNTLYVNDGNANFFDATNSAQLGSSSLSFTGFGSQWFDYDNDSDLDLFVANGNVKLEESRVGISDYPFEQRNQLFRNDTGNRFVDISRSAGPIINALEVSRGAAFGDIDNDGDIDIVVTNNNGPVRLLLNNGVGHHDWLRVKLVGTQSNRDGAGATVALLRDGLSPLYRRARSEGSYLSASDIRVHFGLGKNHKITGIGVIWPLGHREIWRDINVNTELTLTEGTGSDWP
ncbi:MAG: CRTAC1 family protein [Gammaproteobacteria bacterium]|nr:CRTAC1 family protein [Gammaproteobacteria bacterium]